jgi:Phosphotyrosine interaction domain (PTB/PID)
LDFSKLKSSCQIATINYFRSFISSISFIAKTGNSNTTLTNGETINTTATTPTGSDEGHECFVFVSNKLASDITLTIGQAFDLAYR